MYWLDITESDYEFMHENGSRYSEAYFIYLKIPFFRERMTWYDFLKTIHWL